MLRSGRSFCTIAGFVFCACLATWVGAAKPSAPKTRHRPMHAYAAVGNPKCPDLCFPDLPAQLSVRGRKVTLLTHASRLRDIVGWAEDNMDAGWFTSVCSDDLGEGFVVMYDIGSGASVYEYLLYVRSWGPEPRSWHLLCTGPVGLTDSGSYFDRAYLDDRSGSLVFASSHGKVRKSVSVTRPFAAFRRRMDAEKPGAGTR